VPLWIAKGAGAGAREILGTSVISGMLTATGFAIFLIPMLFVVVERISGAERRQRRRQGQDEGSPPGEGPAEDRGEERRRDRREDRREGEREEVPEEAPVGAPG
jgi:hypothetical protein